MILLRFRPYGSADWTSCSFEGEDELLAAENLSLSLAERDSLHIQLADAGEAWLDLPDFNFEREEL